jgi:hypothetical protein
MTTLIERLEQDSLPTVFDIGPITISGAVNWTADALLINDVWAIHCSSYKKKDELVDMDGVWTVTHRPTGLAVHRFHSLALALMCVGSLMGCGVPWQDLTSVEDFSAFAKRHAGGISRFRLARVDIDALDAVEPEFSL